MTTANRFSSLFKAQVKTSSPIESEIKPEPELEIKSELPLESELTLGPELPLESELPLGPELPIESEKSENIRRTSAKKTPTKIILGHRSYEEELREKDEYYLDHGTNVYDILADKEKLASSLVKSKMCSSVDKNEQCQHGEHCRFAHSLDELKISNCLFEQRCRFVRMSNGNLVNNGEKVCSHKHPHETTESFMSRTGLDRYKCAPRSVVQKTSQPQVAQPQVAQPQVAQPQVAQPQVAQPQPPPLPQHMFWQPPPPLPQHMFWQPPPPPLPHMFWQPPLPPLPKPSVDQQSQTKQVAEKFIGTTTSDQILVIRVPKELASQALEIAMKSGKSNIQIEIVN